MTPEEKHTQWLNFHRFQQNREKHFAPKIFKAINSQVKLFIELYKRGLSADYSLMQIDSSSINQALKPLYLDAGIVYGAKVRSQITAHKARMPIGFNQRMIDLMNAYFQTDILNVSEGITETTREYIRLILSRAVEQGQGIDWIVKQLENTEISRIRSRLIARTETVTAANQGAIFAAKDTGLLCNKEWLATMDNRTRHDHRIVDGQKIAMDAYFNLPGGVKMLQPGDRGGKNGQLRVPAKEVVNCRCTVLIEPVRDRSGRLVEA